MSTGCGVGVRTRSVWVELRMEARTGTHEHGHAAIGGNHQEEPTMVIRTTSLAAASLAIAVAALAPSAHALTITRGFSGLWLDAATSARAFSAEVVQTSSGKQLHAFWFTKDAAGRPQWVRAKGAVQGDRAVLDATAAGSSTPWGKLTVTFNDCSKGTVAIAPIDARLPRGQATIVRAAPSSDGSCTGGISDDRTVSSNGGRIVEFLENTGVVRVASGKARFEERSNRTDFKVEAEDLPIGDYALRVGGVERAVLEVRTAVTGTEGEVEFRSPVEPGKTLLDFDPREAVVEIAQGDTVFLRTKFGSGVGADDDPGTVPGGSVDFYEMRVETSNDGPELHARLEDRPGRADFSVELEDVSAGSYVLDVGGVERGTIEVVAVARGTEGEIEFRDPPEPGHFLLDFDPRGEVVQVRRGGAVVLSGVFPTEPTDGDDDGGGNGGGSDDPPGDDNGGHGGDDPPGDDNGGHGGDDDDDADDDRGGHGGHGGDDHDDDDRGGHGDD